MRLTDDQVRQIKDRAKLYGPRQDVSEIEQDRARLLNDREALLDRLEYNVSQNTSLVQELAGLKAENVKLRKVVEAAENALLYARDLRNPYEADQLKRALDAIDTKDATDDKG